VRSRTESPCPRRAEVEILSVAFCRPCAREQEAYFAIGELTHEEARGLQGGALADALKKMRRRGASSMDGITAEMHYQLPGVHESKPPALRSG